MRADARPIARNAVLNLVGQALPLAVGLVAIPTIARGLGSDRLGLLGLGWVALNYFAVLDLGMGRAATRFAAAALSRGADEELGSIIWSAVAVQVPIGLAGTAALATSADFLSEHVIRVSVSLLPDAVATFNVLAVAIPVVIVAASFRGGLEAARRFDIVNAVSVPGGVLNFLVPMAGALLGWRLSSILWLLVASRTASMLCYALLFLRLFPGSLRARPTVSRIRTLLTFGAWATTSGIVSPVLDQLDRFLLAALAGLTSVGQYTVSQEIVLRVRILPTALAQTLLPEFSGHSGSTGDSPRLYARAIRILAMVLTPGAIAVMFLAPDALRAWAGSEFGTGSARALQWLAAGALLNSIAFIPVIYLHGINRPDLPAKFHLVELPLFLLLAWAVMPRWGAAGAGACWAARAAADATLQLRAAARKGAAHGTSLHAAPTSLWAGLAACCLALGFATTHMAIALRTRAVLALGCIAAITAASWLVLLDGQDRDMVRALLRGAGARLAR